MLIQELRLKRKWTQEQLAVVSGLSTRTIQRLENGQKPSLETLKCLSAALEVDISMLDTERHDMQQNNQTDIETQAQTRPGRDMASRKRYFSLLIYGIATIAFITYHILSYPRGQWIYFPIGIWGSVLLARLLIFPRLFGVDQKHL